jgi:hypothetical protein
MIVEEVINSASGEVLKRQQTFTEKIGGLCRRFQFGDGRFFHDNTKRPANHGIDYFKIFAGIHGGFKEVAQEEVFVVDFIQPVAACDNDLGA